jgi:hypothetical protein
MDRKEIKAQVVQLLADGVAKSEVFSRLAGQGIKDRAVAYQIAAYADPQRCRANHGHLIVVRVIAWLQVLLGLLIGFAIGIRISPVAGLICAGVIGGFALLFVWGFSKNSFIAYRAYLLLTITQFPRQLTGFDAHPMPTLISLLIGLALFAYIWFVRSRIFPDFNFVSPRKVNGRYVFAE